MNIKKICKFKNISFKELADKTSISLTYIYELARGKKSNPSMETLLKLSEALEVSVSELIQDNNKINQQ